MKPLVLNIVGLIVAAIAFLIGTPWGIVFGFMATAVSAIAAYWQYSDSVPFRMHLTQSMFAKNSNGEWGVLILGETHRKGEKPKVTLLGFTAAGAYVEMLSSTRYLGNGDLEIAAYPMELDIEIRG